MVIVFYLAFTFAAAKVRKIFNMCKYFLEKTLFSQKLPLSAQSEGLGDAAISPFLYAGGHGTEDALQRVEHALALFLVVAKTIFHQKEQLLIDMQQGVGG